MRERGLKLPITGGVSETTGVAYAFRTGGHGGINTGALVKLRVAPHAGAWIETEVLGGYGQGMDGRSPCGSVD